MDEELKPCPFCGGTADKLLNENDEFEIVCTDCFAVGPAGDNGYYEIIQLWNKRVHEA